MPATYQATATYESMVQGGADTGAGVQTVNGVPAYVAPPETDAGGTPHPGYILYTKNNVQVNVEGYYSADQLKQVAVSLG